jgi:hypothetical protein
MKLKALIFLLVSSFVLVGCLNQSADNRQNTQTQQTEQSQTGKPFSGTLKAALAMGIPMKCTYEVDGNQMEGVISGQKYAGKMDIQGKTGNVIIKDNCMWSWEEATKKGMKTCFEPTDEQESIWDDPDYENPEVTYNCNPTIVTEATFTPPGDVQFMDLEDLMKNPQNYMGE